RVAYREQPRRSVLQQPARQRCGQAAMSGPLTRLARVQCDRLVESRRALLEYQPAGTRLGDLVPRLALRGAPRRFDAAGQIDPRAFEPARLSTDALQCLGSDRIAGAIAHPLATGDAQLGGQ